MNEGDYEWVLRSIRGFGDELFNGKRIKPWNYINGGFVLQNLHIKKAYIEKHKAGCGGETKASP